MTSLSELMELNRLSGAEVEKYPKKRELFHSLTKDTGRHFTGIVGPRGVGKTIILKQLAREKDRSFYISVDTLKEEDLFTLVKKLNTDYKIDNFFLDEVHFSRDFDATLKKIYDFLKVRVFFTSSVALAMFASSHDLSRRVMLRKLLPFSLREYAMFKNGTALLPLTFDDIEKKNWTTEHLFAETLFDQYLKGGLMPFSLEEEDALPLLSNILNKILQRDIPTVARLAIDEIDALRKVLEFVGKSAVEGINYSSISRNVGITKYKAASYVGILEKAFVLQTVFPAGANVLNEPKVLMSVPYRLLYGSLDDRIGGLREDFFAEMMRAGGFKFHYLKSRRGAKTPDFVVDDGRRKVFVEIGGKGKGRSQFKGIEVDKKLVFSHLGSFEGNRRPLFLLGLVA